MKNLKLKILISIILLLICLIVPNKISAAITKDLVVLQSETGNNIIYVKDCLSNPFKFAISKVKDSEPSTYLTSAIDTANQSVNTAYTSEEGKIFLWIKDSSDNYLVSNQEIDLSNAPITVDQIENLETVTKRISVNTSEKEETVTIEENFKKTVTTGVLKITDSENAEYLYISKNVKDNPQYSKFFNLVEDLKQNQESMGIFEKLSKIKEYTDLFNELTNVEEWKEVKDLRISQPENSINGDKYIVFLKKYENDNQILDAQMLISTEEHSQEEIKEQVSRKELIDSPKTVDPIIVVVAILMIAIIFLIITFIIRNKKNRKI